ncbi:hypothetical protein AB0M87_25145 [Streptomyces sp. NPDC051320]|uniref:hypothetical protein n=1 Tax=Streptomyces sp. NPDC051320 TaxID=3154644 RepID=UPI0034422A09
MSEINRNNQAGNGMPNEGPDHFADGLDEDELALRRLMHGAVKDLRPSEEALDHLYKAVPARRARRRQVLVGAAAAVLLVGTAIPAFIHVAGAGGGPPRNPVAVGHRHHPQDSTGPTEGDGGGKKATDSPSGSNATGKGGKQHKPSATGKDAHAGTPTGAGDPSSSSSKSLPICDAQQLGVTSASTAPADADGTVYGTFRVSNVSGTQCSITDPGTVHFQAMGAADPARIAVVDHTAGDPAARLPDPSLETTGLVLKPSKAYEVKFAWVPSDTCPSEQPSPDPTPSGGSDSTGSTGQDVAPQNSANTSPQLAYGDGDTSDGSVAVVHEAEPGVPAAEATIPNACAGTIYRTGVLDTP